MFDTPIHTGEQSIARVLQADLPTLLVFWREGCAPCQQLDPILARLARAYAGKALIAKVNAADNPNLVQRYGITHLPGLVFVRRERVEGQGAGAAPESALRAWLAYLTGESALRPPLPDGPSIPLQDAPKANGRPASGSSKQERPQRASAASSASPPHNAHPLTLNDANFDQLVLRSELPVLVDFWAEWCGPCRMIAPTVAQLAQEFAGRAVVGKLNVDENPRTAQRFQIMSIPALYIFKKGQVVDRLIGVQPAPVLRQRLLRHLRSTP
jgi:thioredoxin 1